MNVLKSCEPKMKFIKNSKSILPTTILRVYCAQAMAPSVQTESLINFVLITKSKTNTQFLRLLNKMALRSDTTELYFEQVEVS